MELPSTKGYEFGDSLANWDTTQTVVNAMLRHGGAEGLQLHNRDIEVHRRNSTHQVRNGRHHGYERIDAIRRPIHQCENALALQGLISTEYPGDFLRFIEMYTFAKLRSPGELVG